MKNVTKGEPKCNLYTWATGCCDAI